MATKKDKEIKEEKTRYSDKELGEFKELIMGKLKQAKEELTDARSADHIQQFTLFTPHAMNLPIIALDSLLSNIISLKQTNLPTRALILHLAYTVK